MIGCVYAWGLLGGNMPNNMARVKMLCAKRFPTDTLIIIGTHGFFVNCLFLGFLDCLEFHLLFYVFLVHGVLH